MVDKVKKQVADIINNYETVAANLKTMSAFDAMAYLFHENMEYGLCDHIDCHGYTEANKLKEHLKILRSEDFLFPVARYRMNVEEMLNECIQPRIDYLKKFL